MHYECPNDDDDADRTSQFVNAGGKYVLLDWSVRRRARALIIVDIFVRIQQ